ncbi:hypothetical protein ATCC90586_000842 [Pythium insidiosum]|nr:hypothetical protein ATCC90586_000842 [Pythium insidiosum]
MAGKRHADGSAPPSWLTTLQRAILVQLVCSMLLQLSYVAFPAYNFALALWSLGCCASSKEPLKHGPLAKHPRLALLLLGALAFSIVTDVVWISLWVSGTVFYDQYCGQAGVSIVSCGGGSDYFPGCQTNRFALVALVATDVAKCVSMVCLQRLHVELATQKKKTATAPTQLELHGAEVSTEAGAHDATTVDIPPLPLNELSSSNNSHAAVAPTSARPQLSHRHDKT